MFHANVEEKNTFYVQNCLFYYLAVYDRSGGATGDNIMLLRKDALCMLGI